MSEKVSPFVWLDAITQKKGDPMADHGEGDYPAFMINRGLSYYPDCVMYAAELNLYPDLAPRLQYDYLREGIRSKKRFAKWGKKLTNPDVEMVQEAFNCSRSRALEHLRILTKEQLETIRESMPVQ